MDFVDIFQRNDDIKNLTLTLGSALDPLPFDDNTFDAVSINYGCLAFNSEQWVTVVKDINRVLKPGGYMLSREPADVVSILGR
jgi:ubiquinone/menaquinone biosynthesis C-methylase UbiE